MVPTEVCRPWAKKLGSKCGSSSCRNEKNDSQSRYKEGHFHSIPILLRGFHFPSLFFVSSSLVPFLIRFPRICFPLEFGFFIKLEDARLAAGCDEPWGSVAPRSLAGINSGTIGAIFPI